MADLLFHQKRQRKFQHRKIGLDQLTDEELRSRYRFNQVYLVGILKDDLPKADDRKPCDAPYFSRQFSRHVFFRSSQAGGRKTR